MRAKHAYYQSLFADLGRQHPDVTLRIINNVMGRQSKTMVLNTIIHNGPNPSGKSLADHSNQQFVIAAIKSNTPLITTKKISKNTVQESIFMQPTDEYEVYSTYIRLKTVKHLTSKICK